jgi:electron transfer flavoprotein beta subunit
MPCIAAAVSLTMKTAEVEAERKGDRGGRQVVVAPFPCTILFEEIRTPRYPSIEEVTKSLIAPIEEWELADLGIPFWDVGATGACLPVAEFGVPRPDPVRAVTPDPQLPAFERILSLLSGGIKAREGRTHAISADDTAEGLLRILGEEGLIP